MTFDFDSAVFCELAPRSLVGAVTETKYYRSRKNHRTNKDACFSLSALFASFLLLFPFRLCLFIFVLDNSVCVICLKMSTLLYSQDFRFLDRWL